MASRAASWDHRQRDAALVRARDVVAGVRGPVGPAHHLAEHRAVVPHPRRCAAARAACVRAGCPPIPIGNGSVIGVLIGGHGSGDVHADSGTTTHEISDGAGELARPARHHHLLGAGRRATRRARPRSARRRARRAAGLARRAREHRALDALRSRSPVRRGGDQRDARAGRDQRLGDAEPDADERVEQLVAARGRSARRCRPARCRARAAPPDRRGEPRRAAASPAGLACSERTQWIRRVSSPGTYSRIRNVPSVGWCCVGRATASSPPAPSSLRAPSTVPSRGSTENVAAPCCTTGVRVSPSESPSHSASGGARCSPRTAGPRSLSSLTSARAPSAPTAYRVVDAVGRRRCRSRTAASRPGSARRTAGPPRAASRPRWRSAARSRA